MVFRVVISNTLTFRTHMALVRVTVLLLTLLVSAEVDAAEANLVLVKDTKGTIIMALALDNYVSK
jgi:hypothetical protein